MTMVAVTVPLKDYLKTAAADRAANTAVDNPAADGLKGTERALAIGSIGAATGFLSGVFVRRQGLPFFFIVGVAPAGGGGGGGGDARVCRRFTRFCLVRLSLCQGRAACRLWSLMPALTPLPDLPRLTRGSLDV